MAATVSPPNVPHVTFRVYVLMVAVPGPKQKGDKETLRLCPHLVPTHFDCIGKCVPDTLVTAPSENGEIDLTPVQHQ
jgi:hypothetical protein